MCVCIPLYREVLLISVFLCLTPRFVSCLLSHDPCSGSCSMLHHYAFAAQRIALARVSTAFVHISHYRFRRFRVSSLDWWWRAPKEERDSRLNNYRRVVYSTGGDAIANNNLSRFAKSVSLSSFPHYPVYIVCAVVKLNHYRSLFLSNFVRTSVIIHSRVYVLTTVWSESRLIQTPKFQFNFFECAAASIFFWATAKEALYCMC
uniref:Putative secreted protein n=1 Tax=Anopheles darlingi TaxID=43151 RepID=A0A2M4DFB3_ANODA